MDTVYLAGGCFWGTEKFFDCLPGVTATEVGYANGKTANPTYEQVKYEGAGHAETVKVTYDPAVISLDGLLEMYFKIIDPTSVNKQGEDEGVQYRTGIYYTNDAQREAAERALGELQKQYAAPLAVECRPLEHFYTAEEYHQKYLDKNPAGYCHLSPAMFELARQYGKEN